MNLTTYKWTTVAQRPVTGGKWNWIEGYNSEETIKLAMAGEVIVMHRHRQECLELVARFPGPAWRRMQNDMQHRRGRWA
jgi:hypothetical protein